MGVLSYEEYLAQAKKALADSKSKGDESINKQAAEQKKVLQENYDIARNETERSYDDKYRINAVQKLINEREIAEDMANIGHRDSGLSRTQQTAAQLSYSNNRAKLDRQQQSQLDALARELASSVSTVEQNRLSALAENEEIHSKAAAEQATSAYNKQQELLEAARKEAEQSAAQKTNRINSDNGFISRAFSGTLGENGVHATPNYEDGEIVSYTYTDTITGKKTTFGINENPYTDKKNSDVNNGTFKNTPYQPDNISGNKLKKSVDDNNDVLKIYFNGQWQSVWEYKKNPELDKINSAREKRGLSRLEKTYYCWDGANNTYRECTPIKDEKGNITDWKVDISKALGGAM